MMEEQNGKTLGELLAEEYELLGCPTRSLWLRGDGLEGRYIGMGISDCGKFYDMAKEDRIPEAEKLDVDYAFNCDAKFRGTGLAAFLQRVYPEVYAKVSENITPDGEYWISSIDYS